MKFEIQNILNQLAHYSDIEDPVEIDARFNPIIPIKPLPKLPIKYSYDDPLIKPSQINPVNINNFL